MRRVQALGAVLVCAVLAVGCGDEELATTTTAAETADPLPQLPARWSAFHDREHGFAIGLPPGWGHGSGCAEAGAGQPAPPSAAGAAAVLCAPDRLTTVTIAVDRSRGATGLPVDEFAAAAFRALSKAGYGGSLRGDQPTAFGQSYDAAAVSGRGEVAGSGFDQDVQLIVLRRDELANFTVVIASNAKRTSRRERRQATLMVITLRDDPPAGAAKAPSQASGRSG